MFEPLAKDRPIEFDAVRVLSGEFQTSMTATAIRLVEYGSFPAMLVCSEGTRQRWFVRSPDVPERIWPHDELSPYTYAYELQRGSLERQLPCDVGAAGWVNYPNSECYSVCEDSIKVGSNLVLSLIWWKDEKQLLDLGEDDEEENY